MDNLDVGEKLLANRLGNLGVLAVGGNGDGGSAVHGGGDGTKVAMYIL